MVSTREPASTGKGASVAIAALVAAEGSVAATLAARTADRGGFRRLDVRTTRGEFVADTTMVRTCLLDVVALWRLVWVVA